ncbi:hypothetical protein C0991_001226 [Blastosporella zonata]|nr:hypothetical protein C0991_001226 [Blastosporella zonata]
MNQDVIDLTKPEVIDVDEATDATIPTPASMAAPDRERKRSRRKKRKRTLAEGESTPSAAQTRETSPEEGEIECKKTRKENLIDSSLPVSGKGPQRPSEKNERHHIPLPIPSTSTRSKDTGKENIFFIDVEPVPLPAAVLFPSTSTATRETSNELLLPVHVSVFGAEPAEILAPERGELDDDYIDYLDFDDSSRNIARYFDDPLPESSKHSRTECPTLWRLYEYLTEEARCLLLRRRKEKQHLSLGEGGEGYIADDEWCYNCGNLGHWGDDCQDMPHREDIPDEFSAFSEHNTLSGPFFDSVPERSALKRLRREPRDWESHNDLPPSWGNVPDNVGKKGRRDNAAKMERRAQEQAVEDDPDDWFGNPQNARNRGTGQKNDSQKADPPRKMAFGKSLQESTRYFHPPSPPKLLDRIGDAYYSDSRRRDSRDMRPSRKPDRDHRRDDRYERDRERDRDRRRRDGAGPRYKGGYSR